MGDKWDSFTIKFLVLSNSFVPFLLKVLKWGVILVIAAIVLMAMPGLFSELKLIAPKVEDAAMKAIANCDDLKEEVMLDMACLNNKSCTMTREELAEATERAEKSARYCQP